MLSKFRHQLRVESSILGTQHYQLCALALETPAWGVTLEQEAF